ASGLKAAEIEFAESVPEDTVYGSTLASRPASLWSDMIAGAGKTLDIEEFYIANAPGEALEPVLAALKAAAARGVKVRVLVESAMMKETGRTLPELKREPNVETRVISFRKVAGGVQHAKFFIVDGREVFVGSQNFDWRSLTQIHETGARIASERAARAFGAVFEADWAMAAGEDPEKALSAGTGAALNAGKPEKAYVRGEPVLFSLAFSPERAIPPGFDSELKGLLKLIKGAKRTIRAQVMTYSLAGLKKGSRWAKLDKALRAAGRRGVKVELMFADWAMGGRADEDIKSLALAANVSVKLSSIPQAERGFVPYSRVDHCKYLTADGERAMLSTSNWAADYFFESRGAALVLEGAAGAAPLEDIFRRSWNGPYAAPVEQDRDYAPVRRT
ncbi:MAG TPA: phospholipase D-like domain-containing protein, partial [Elusimicrobiales bacterium]|nr:phospholipase D-like domain-containing protein [Elusimicrobiales bacterium]